MIEYQGWVVVRESYNEEKESDELLNEIREKLSAKVSIINSGRLANVCTLTLVNGNLNLLIASLDNHKSSSWDEMVDLFNWLSLTHSLPTEERLWQMERLTYAMVNTSREG